MIDIDYFKKINDTYGHDVGDKVIQALVSEISKITRNSDLFARFGGEEFITLFPYTDLEGASVIAEKMRQIIANCNPVMDISFTISIGISQLDLTQSDGLGQAIKEADKALYIAKNKGRNRVEIFTRT